MYYTTLLISLLLSLYLEISINIKVLVVKMTFMKSSKIIKVLIFVVNKD